MRVFTLVLAILASPVAAHELWLEPGDFTVPAEATVTAQIVNGSDFTGQNLPFLPQRFARFDDVVNGRASAVPGRVGDIPAVQLANPPEGLNVLVYQARNATVDYKDWATFVSFTEHKDFPGILEAHAARGLPEEAFREVYSRYSKSLVSVGTGAGTEASHIRTLIRQPTDRAMFLRALPACRQRRERVRAPTVPKAHGCERHFSDPSDFACRDSIHGTS